MSLMPIRTLPKQTTKKKYTSSTPEGKVKDVLRNYLEKHKIWYYCPVSGGYSRNGVPDFFILHNGRFIGVEVKRDGEKATALQRLEGEKIVAAGGTWFEVAGIEAMQEFVKTELGE